MAATAQAKADQAYDQVVGWMEHFEPIEDPRQSGKVDYPLVEILLLVLLAVLSGAAGSSDGSDWIPDGAVCGRTAHLAVA